MLTSSKKRLNRKLSQVVKTGMTLSIALSLTQLVYAGNDSETISFYNQTPDANELLNAFLKHDKSEQAGQPHEKAPLLMRGIGFKKKPSSSPIYMANAAKQMDGAALCQAGSQSVSVSINFNNNSSNIKNRDSELIKNIANAMNSPELQHCFFTVEGHTDARGNDFYNLWLSQERAQEVKNQLNGYNIIDKRLIVVGKGESQLLNNHNPNSAENRRVEFKVINYLN